jgi:hypothetical protein
MSVARRLARRGPVAAVVAVALAACAPAVREVVRDGMDESTRRGNWDKLRTPARELAGEVTRGVLDAGASSQLVAQLDASIDRFVRTVLHAASQELDGEVSPAMSRAVRAAVDAALAAILDDGTIRRVENIADALTAAALAGFARGIRDQVGPAMASALDRSLGPAMQRAIENNVGPAVAATLRKDLTPALADAARCASAAAGEGFAAGAGKAIENGIEPLLGRAQQVLDRADQDSHAIARSVLVATLGMIAGVLAIGLWLRHRTAVAARAALQLVTREIGEMRTAPAVQELGRRIKTAGEGSTAGAFLADHLRAHPSSKFTPPPAPWDVQDGQA